MPFVMASSCFGLNRNTKLPETEHGRPTTYILRFRCWTWISGNIDLLSRYMDQRAVTCRQDLLTTGKGCKHRPEADWSTLGTRALSLRAAPNRGNVGIGAQHSDARPRSWVIVTRIAENPDAPHRRRCA